MLYKDFSMLWPEIHAKVSVRYVNLVILPLAKIITFVLLKLKLTPNFISVLSSASLIIGAVIFMQTSSVVGYILFIILSQFSYILDHCDGAIARIKKTSSKFGALLDVALDRFNVLFLFIAVGMKTFSSADYSYHQILYFCLAALIYNFYQYVSSLQPHYFHELKGYMRNDEDQSIVKKLVKIVYEFIDTGIMYLLIGLSLIFNFQYWLIIFYGFIGAILVSGLFFILYRSEKSEG